MTKIEKYPCGTKIDHLGLFMSVFDPLDQGCQNAILEGSSQAEFSVLPVILPYFTENSPYYP